MEVILAESAGFCFGVKRAVDIVYEQLDEGRDGIYTYGMVIHNEEVTRDLEKKGVRIIESPEEIAGIKGGTLIIRSHGAGRAVYEKAEESGVRVKDATCPFVKKIHDIVDKESRSGRHIVIIGDGEHPEVCGVAGWATGPVTIISKEEEAFEFSVPEGEKITVVSQTTFNIQKFKQLVEIIKVKGYDMNVMNTICSATALRQKEAAEISKKADSMIVIGDRRSSNTRKLYDICKSNCKDTYHIETVKDLTAADLQSSKCVGITAGASTPNYLIQEVLLYVRGI